MLSKLLTLTFVIAITSVSAEDSQEVDLFHKESDFMRGFETGLFLRSKNGDVADYGCEIPKEANNAAKMAFDQIKMSIEMAKSKLKVDPVIDQGLNLVLDFMGGL